MKKLIITLSVFLYAIVVPFLEINATHVFNPDWTPHVKIHEVWQLITNSSIGLFCLWMVWIKKEMKISAIISLLITGGFLLAYVLQSLYGGSMRYLDGSEKILLGVNIGVLGFGIAFTLLLLTLKTKIAKNNKITILIIALFFNLPFNTYSQSLDQEHWIKDIDFYKAQLEQNHIDLYNTISKVEFENEIQQIKLTLNKKSETEIIIDLMRLTRKIGDGHTAFSLRGLETHLFPIEVYNVNGKWRVIKAAKEHKNLLGKIITTIEGKQIDYIEKEVGEIAQYVENKQSKIIRSGEYMMISELLFGLKLTNHEFKANFTFLDDITGEETNISLNAVNKKDYYENTDFMSIQSVTPQVQKPTNTKFDYLWFTPIKGTKGVYIKFESYPSFEEMEQFGESVLNFINKNDTKKVVIDLRNNGGGDLFVGTFLAYYLNLANGIDWKSGVYVLTDKVTFSAATSNASQFRQILNAKIVGESTGSNPSGYQDMGQFKLPNSRMTVTYSKRLFRFQSKVTQGVQPDVLIEYDWESFSKGIDNILDWVINNIQSN